MNREFKALLAVLAGFFMVFYLPVGNVRFDHAVTEAFHLVRWYAREHVLLCLVPAFFIAGAISVFVSRAAVMKYLGARANQYLAYGVASVSGTILAVCSCTVLPLFAGIYKRGAGLGPATAFLYSGPAINVLAIILTARILGFELGVARAVGAILFSVVIGVLMQFIFRKEEVEKAGRQMMMPEPEVNRPLWQNAVYFAAMVAILVFANWGKPTGTAGLWHALFSVKWLLTSLFAGVLGVILIFWFGMKWWKVALAAIPVAAISFVVPHEPLFPFTAGVAGLTAAAGTGEDETREWLSVTWGYAKQILPLLLFGVLIAGFLLGRPGEEGVIPSVWIEKSVGGNSIVSNFFAAFAGAFMYFATLTEVPIIQGLIGAGMGKGPALALLLAGPALSLPNMLVIRSVMGTKKTVVYVGLVVVMATVSGMIFGAL
jgi:uncharacterized membrane protein YraQ (UPF0718 family)